MQRPCSAAFVLTILSFVLSLEASDSDSVKHLIAAQQRANDGVIHFTPESFGKYVTGKERPFTLFVFLTADHLMDKPGLKLGGMRKEFGYVAKKFKDRLNQGEFKEKAGKLFFAEAEFKESQELFMKLQVSTLPFVFILSGNTAADRERIKIKPDNMMKPENTDNFPWKAEEFDAFMAERIGVSVGKVDRPSLVTSPFFPFIALAMLTTGAFVGYQLYYAPFMKNLMIWSSGAILIYWFSVSGGMHNIIRGIPLYVLTQQGAQFFMPPGQGQLGAEGFLCGTGYLLVGLSVSGITYLHKLVPGLEAKKQRYVAFGILAIGLWSFFKVVGVYRWKTGYHWRTYFAGRH